MLSASSKNKPVSSSLSSLASMISSMHCGFLSSAPSCTMSSASSCLAQGEVRPSLGSAFYFVWYVLGGCCFRLMPMLSTVLCSATHGCELHEFDLYGLDGGGGGLACSLCSALWPCGLGSSFFHAHRFNRELRSTFFHGRPNLSSPRMGEEGSLAVHTQLNLSSGVKEEGLGIGFHA
ncbi:hypothetical protein Dimus_029645 [Dionaea muscipula]